MRREGVGSVFKGKKWGKRKGGVVHNLLVSTLYGFESRKADDEAFWLLSKGGGMSHEVDYLLTPNP